MNKLLKSNRRSVANYGERIIGRIAAMSSLLLSLALSFAFALAQAQTSEGVWCNSSVIGHGKAGIVWDGDGGSIHRAGVTNGVTVSTDLR